MKKLAGILFGLGLALNAHALCVNPDGALGDPSVPAFSAQEMLPSCEATTAGRAGQKGEQADLGARANGQHEAAAPPIHIDPAPSGSPAGFLHPQRVMRNLMSFSGCLCSLATIST